MQSKRKSPRLTGYDYSQSGGYFVTICTKSRRHFFAETQNRDMKLTSAGRLVQQYREEIPNHFGDVILDEFVIMPNHIHGIIYILRRDDALHRPKQDKDSRQGDALSLRKRISPVSGSLPTIIGSFKSICTKMIRRAGTKDFARQSRYYDHIIRNDRDLERIRSYIVENPSQREQDCFF